MLIEIAIGDAYGAGFEYVDEKVVVAGNDLTGYTQHPRHATRPGQYTDDTQMSIAVAEAILSAEAWTPNLIADHFVGCYKRDPRDGYSRGFAEFLKIVSTGTEVLEKIAPASDKSGAAMRSAPIGVFADVDEVIEKARVQAAITHNTSDGVNASVAVALMSHYCIYRRGPKSNIARFVERHVPGNWSEPWRGKVGAKGWMSVRAAITAVMASRRLSELLKMCIAFTGDVDTVAAIALGVASSCVEMENDIPQVLLDDLENGVYGRDYLRTLDGRLMNLVNNEA